MFSALRPLLSYVQSSLALRSHMIAGSSALVKVTTSHFRVVGSTERTNQTSYFFFRLSTHSKYHIPSVDYLYQTELENLRCQSSHCF